MSGARQSAKSPHGFVTEYAISESAFMYPGLKAQVMISAGARTRAATAA
jgi:hypothetical protein